jgi:hypothetical protein
MRIEVGDIIRFKGESTSTISLCIRVENGMLHFNRLASTKDATGTGFWRIHKLSLDSDSFVKIPNEALKHYSNWPCRSMEFDELIKKRSRPHRMVLWED